MQYAFMVDHKNTTVYTALLRANLSEILGRVHYNNEIVRVIRRGGKLVAAIVSPKDLELLEAAKTAAAAIATDEQPNRSAQVRTKIGTQPNPP
jgi:hypothetical protein